MIIKMKKFQSNQFQNVILITALFCLGYIASLFLTYSFIVMPGLFTLDDRAFVAAFQGLETRFQNAEQIPGYESFGYGNIPALIAFPGAIVCLIIAGILNWKTIQFRWIIAAFIIFIAGMITTVMYNLPSNIGIFTAGDPKLIDVKQVRLDFNESSWLRWNHFRALTTSIAMLCLTPVLYFRIKSSIK